MCSSQTFLGNKDLSASIVNSMCPYKTDHSEHCNASVMRMRIDIRRSTAYCLTGITIAVLSF